MPEPQTSSEDTTTAVEPIIQVRDLVAGYGDFVVLRNVSFEVRPGEVFAILGGSGCGKTTLLRHMIGLIPPLAGSIRIEGSELVDADEPTVLRILRRFGVMYQQGALFGSMTLLENVMVPLEEQSNLPARARQAVAQGKLSMVGLGGYSDFLPNEISGGMRKRAAIARALALDPRIIFLDEPSAGLDPVTAAGLDKLIVKLSSVLGTTFVMVTHELASILSIVDRCIMLDRRVQGIVATGDPKVMMAESTNPLVRAFFDRDDEAEGGA